ncbi:Holliday junction resolvase RuvX [Shigella boydii]
MPAIKAQDDTPDWTYPAFMKKWQPDEIIVGLPLNMDGTVPLTARARKFANRIHGRFGVEAKLDDERLNTVEARWSVRTGRLSGALQKAKLNLALAVIILKAISSRDIKAI